VKPEQKVGIASTAYGAAMGIFSAWVGTLAIAGLVPIAGYVGLVFAMKRMESEKKAKWIVGQGVLSFLLVWVVVWILVFNMR
jgi:hypothetical protein